MFGTRRAKNSCLSFGLTALVLGGGMAAWVGFLLVHQLHPEQQGLTLQVEGHVVKHWLTTRRAMPAPDYRITYDYGVRGHTYEATGLSVDGEWDGGAVIQVCVDPQKPERHAPLIRVGASCGDHNLHNSTGTAKRLN